MGFLHQYTNVTEILLKVVLNTISLSQSRNHFTHFNQTNFTKYSTKLLILESIWRPRWHQYRIYIKIAFFLETILHIQINFMFSDVNLKIVATIINIEPYELHINSFFWKLSTHLNLNIHNLMWNPRFLSLPNIVLKKEFHFETIKPLETNFAGFSYT